MEWGTKRKLLYALAVTIVLAASTVFLLRGTLFPAPTCIDGKQNGYESGIDCGGTCALLCRADVYPLTVMWAKAVRSEKGVYDLVAMINNPNIDNAAAEVGFSFDVYDQNGKVMVTLAGSTTVPIGGKFPVIIQGVPLATPPTNVSLTLTDGPHYAVKESPSSPTVKIIGTRFEQDTIPRVYGTVVNTKHKEITNLPVRVVLYDAQNNAYAVGETVVPLLPKEGVKEIVFTWGGTLLLPPVRIEVYPIFDPFNAIEY
jgi:hypothetical protein